MGSNINIKARIERHSRVLQHNIYRRTRKGGKTGLTIVSLVSIFLLPIYPTFASFVNNTSVTEFYRGNIDESTIISSYFWDDSTVGDGDVFIQAKDSYLYVNAALDEDKRDTSTSSEIIEYEVAEGESFASIAEKFNISKDSIFWANNFNTEKEIHPGDTIKVPPVSGLIHKVVAWETLGGLSNKYEIDSEDIMRQNLLLKASDLQIGDTIMIPGAKKEIPKPPAPKPVYTAKTTATQTQATGSSGGSQYVNTSGRYNLVWRAPYSGAPGNCTWYVASHKGVNWRGNANQWMRNAAAKWHAIGYSPSVWAIIQFAGRGYNPYYGHVGIVIDVTATHIIVSDMNYRRKYEVTTRKIPINDRSIQWYIYVN